MNRHAFDALTRRAGALSRRGSLRALGGVALATTLAAPANARAGKAGKNKNKNTNAKKQCKKQQAQCDTAVTEFCMTWIDRTACEGLFLPCCAQFADCNVEPGLACLLAASLDV